MLNEHQLPTICSSQKTILPLFELVYPPNQPGQNQHLWYATQARPGRELTQSLSAASQINKAMYRQEATLLFMGTEQSDDVYLNGKCSGGKHGGGSENKAPFVAAFSMSDVGQQVGLKLKIVTCFTSEVVAN